jgi:hypothetical protein
LANVVKRIDSGTGQSFALIAGVSDYPNLASKSQLPPAAEDIRKLVAYLRDYEGFDEIVVLKNRDMTFSNLQYFLQTYFPKRLRASQKSRFLLAYSGHGMTDEGRGYLLTSDARSLSDKENSINLTVVRSLADEVVDAGYHVLVLLNACYGAAFISRPFGDHRLTDREPGAHAITAGGTGQLTWHLPSVGTGSVFFEKFLAGLGGQADIYPRKADETAGDGIITVEELVAYLKEEVKISTDYKQNPQDGDISRNGSLGSLFFYSRRPQLALQNVPPYRGSDALAMGDAGVDSATPPVSAFKGLSVRFHQATSDGKPGEFQTSFRAGSNRRISAQHLFSGPASLDTATVDCALSGPRAQQSHGVVRFSAATPRIVEQAWDPATTGWIPGSYTSLCSIRGTVLERGTFEVIGNSPPVPEFRIDTLRFFESGSVAPPRSSWQFLTEFDSASARFINVDVDASWTPPAIDSVPMQIECTYSRRGGDVVGKTTLSIPWSKNSSGARTARGLGWEKSGNWRVGTYDAVCQTGGKTTVGRFVILGATTESFTPAGVIADKLRFFAYDDTIPDYPNLAFTSEFNSARTRELGYLLDLSWPPADRKVRFSVPCMWYTENATAPFKVDTLDFSRTDPRSVGAWVARGHRRTWSSGRYTVRCNTAAGPVLGQFSVAAATVDGATPRSLAVDPIRLFGFTDTIPDRPSFGTPVKAGTSVGIGVSFIANWSQSSRTRFHVACDFVANDGSVMATAERWVDVTFPTGVEGTVSQYRRTGWPAGDIRVVCNVGGIIRTQTLRIVP